MSAQAVPVTAKGWSYTHPGRSNAVFNGLDLEVDAGQRVLLLGPSGCGKSTLLHALAGVLGSEEAQESGELMVDGRSPRAARGRAGLMQQDPETQVILPRVGDDVAFGAENLCVPASEIPPRVQAALAGVGLDLPWNHSSSALSGGQKQRLALAGILAMRPGLILLDEPTANLDPAGVAEVVAAVASALADRESTLLVVEHRVESWIGMMDRVIVLGSSGEIIADGQPGRVLAEQGEYLASRGVWVPGWQPKLGQFSPQGLESAGLDGEGLPSNVKGSDDLSSGTLLRARNLEIGRGTTLPGAHSLDIMAGSATVLTGVNGAGKSTLALTPGGLLPPRSGVLEASEELAQGLGSAPIKWKPKQLVERIGSVFQEPEHQFVTGSVKEELAFGLKHSANKPAAEVITARVDELLERLGLVGEAEVNPFTLSGGQKRRLSVATALAAAPRLLILDEPTFGQDTLTWRSLVELLREQLSAGIAVLAVTHDELFAKQLAARDYRISQGSERSAA